MIVNMRKYLLLHVLTISFVFFLAPTIQATSDVEEEIEPCKQEIRINSDDVDTHINFSTAYGKSDMYKDAIEACKQVIKINSDDAIAHANLGVAYVLFNDKCSALEQYKILKNLDSELANKLFNFIYE